MFQNQLSILFASNFGPVHPAAHGVLRIIIYMCLELVSFFDFELGLLFRSTERLYESRVLIINTGYVERTDYVSGF